MKKRTVVIAEIGENHLGNWDIAKQMITEAARAGADIVKFQSYLGSEVRPEDPEREWFTKVEVTDAVHHELKKHAEAAGVEFLSAPFSLGRAKLLVEGLGLRKIKVASSEMMNVRLLEYLNGRVDTVYLSTGMATIDEIRQSVSRLGKVKDVTILHCVTQYPTKPEDVNLLALRALAEAFPANALGYSDHTIGLDAAVLAVALGARVIEKHFTLGKALPGTDHVLSVTPDELKELVARIRLAESLLGRAVKEPVAGEKEIVSFVRGRFPK